jgi:NAD(P)-dependent dehydrogenase (short-subunit alcohol dehydrogenase family)
VQPDVSKAIDKTSLASALAGKNAVVIGGSRGVGRVIVERLHGQGARVLSVSRNANAPAGRSAGLSFPMTLEADATEYEAPKKVFAALRPDILIVCLGAMPPTAPIHEQDWKRFSINWETDVKASFLFCKAALKEPLRPGSTVVLISSGAAIGGSPISGGYAGAKRMQMFMANYCQKEADRLGLGIRFMAVAPSRIMPETDIGKTAVAGYSRYLGISEADFIKGMSARQSPQDVADAIVSLVDGRGEFSGNIFMVSGKGIESGT